MVLRMASPIKHPKTGVYQFRRRVPADLVDTLGKKEIKRSLGTKDSPEAKRRFSDMWQRYEAEWTLMRLKPEPVPLKTVMALAGEAYRQLVESVDEEPGESSIWDAVLARNEQEVESGYAERWYGPTADGLLIKHGIKADEASRERLLLEIHEAIRQGAETSRRKAEGDYSPDPRADRFPDKPNEAPKRSADGVSLFDLCEAWCKNHEREGGVASTRLDWKRTLTEFTAFLHHSDAEQVTRADVIRWREYLKNETGLTSKTINGKKLAALRSVYSYGKRNMLIDRDPTEGCVEKVKKPKKERSQGFTQAEAEQVLKATLSAIDDPSDTTLRTKFAFRWLPWLCAYSGARAGEIAQLRREDVFHDDIPFIRITPDAGTVKTDEYRDIPLHPHLIAQGFLDFVSSRPSGPLFHEPEKPALNKPQNKSVQSPRDNVRDKVAKWVRHNVGISDMRIQPNHAWRHRFTTICREAGIPQEYARAIQGHSDGSASSGYGELTMKTLYREIKKIPHYEIS